MRHLLLTVTLLALPAFGCGSTRQALDECDDAHPCATGLTCFHSDVGFASFCTKPCTAGCSGIASGITTTCYSGMTGSAVPVPFCAPDCVHEAAPGAYCGQFHPWTSGAYTVDATHCWCL